MCAESSVAYWPGSPASELRESVDERLFLMLYILGEAVHMPGCYL